MSMNIESEICESGESPASGGVPTLRQRQRQVREEAILDAARDMIAETSYDAMTMEDLADRVGISKPTLYQHFPSKEAIAVRAIVAHITRNVQYVRDLAPELTAMARLEHVVGWVVSQRFCRDSVLFGGVKAGFFPALRTHPEYRTARGQFVEMLMDIVHGAQEDGAISRSVSARTVVQMVFSLVRDTEYDELIASGECTAEEVRDTMVKIYFNGLGKANE